MCVCMFLSVSIQRCRHTCTHTQLNLPLTVIREKHAGQPQSPQAEQADTFIEGLGKCEVQGLAGLGGQK